MSTRRRKPDRIDVGKCYRMLTFGLRGDRVLYVSKIEGKKQRWVLATPVHVVQDSTGTLSWPYGEFMRQVHSEEPSYAN